MEDTFSNGLISKAIQTVSELAFLNYIEVELLEGMQQLLIQQQNNEMFKHTQVEKL